MAELYRGVVLGRRKYICHQAPARDMRDDNCVAKRGARSRLYYNRWAWRDGSDSYNSHHVVILQAFLNKNVGKQKSEVILVLHPKDFSGSQNSLDTCMVQI